MTGQALYELHQRATLERGCSMDNWDELDEQTQRDWNRTAQLLWGGE